MVYTCTYKSKLGDILLAADEIGLTGLWFTGQKYFASTLPDEHIPRETPVLSETKEWLDVYFLEKSRPLPRPFILPVQSSGRQYGRFYCRFHTGRPQPTGRLPDSWLT